jgi:hypothetical protein
MTARLAQRIGDRPRGDVHAHARLTAQHEARHQSEDDPDDHEHDQQLQQAETALAHWLTSW